MEKTPITTGKVALNYGLILGLTIVTMAVILYVTNNLLEQNWITSVVSFLILIGFIVSGQIFYKKSNSGFMSLSDALKVGVGIALIGGLIGAVYNYLFLTIIEPGFIELIVDKQRTAMIENSPNMTESQIEDSVVMIRRFAQPWIQSTIQIIGSLFFGFIIALISGLILKKDNPYQE